MPLFVAARCELLPSPPQDQQPAVLLEGTWPAEWSLPALRSLDEAVDARFAWIDADCCRLAESLQETGAGPACLPDVSTAHLNALSLRYSFVKLLRAIVYFTEIQPLQPGQRVELLVNRDRDEDYAEVLEQLCRLAGAECLIHWTSTSAGPQTSLPPHPRWRRWLDLLRRGLEPQADPSDPRRRVILCGNPRILEPVCRELLDRGCAVWWLYDQLALKAWLRWRRRGVGQLVCNSGLGTKNKFRPPKVEFCAYRGVDLCGPVHRWLAKCQQVYGQRQTRLVEQIDAHFARVRPDALVVDEDATPMTRAAAAVCKQHQAVSFVVQHGAPACRFGFAPPSADRLLVWGASSQRQLEAWGVSPERMHVTGSPVHDRLFQTLSAAPQRQTAGDRITQILLLATTPPRDERPDSIALHLTKSTYAGMLRAALAAIAKLPHARLIVKLHPRSPEDPIVRTVAGEYPHVETRWIATGPLEPLLLTADCVLSCFSSAGIDATLAGVPVIQLLPAGSADVLPHDEWGLLGSARTEAELTPLLLQALREGRQTVARPNANVFGNTKMSAVANIADAVLAAGDPSASVRSRLARLQQSTAKRQRNLTQSAARD